jgi:hypothetical protein
MSVLSAQRCVLNALSPQANQSLFVYDAVGQTIFVCCEADHCQAEHVCSVCTIHTRAQRGLTGSCVLDVPTFVGSRYCAAYQTRATSAAEQANTSAGLRGHRSPQANYSFHLA